MTAGEIIAIVLSFIGCLLGIVSIFRYSLARFYEYMMPGKNVIILEKKLEELRDLEVSLYRQLNGPMARGAKWDKFRWWAERADLNLKMINGMTPKIPILDIYSRFKIGRLVVGWIDQTDELLQDGQTLNISEFPNEGKEIMEASEKLVGNKANYAFGKMLMCIRDDEVRIIGVLGMGCVGKTTLVKEIIAKKHLHLYYDTVIWVNVPADGSDLESDLKNTQLAIAKEIQLVLSGTANSLERAAKLRNTLMQRGRYLLILDDMWRGFCLEEIGIPEPTRENGCKLIIISRYSSACNTMKTDKNVELNLLSEDDEAWELFMNELRRFGISVLQGEIQMVAKEVAKQCGGLPSIIIQVARALIKFIHGDIPIIDEITLGEVATQTKESTANFSSSMVEKAFDRLKLSYDRLSRSTRSCFLYCALYPKGHYFGTKELIEYWRWEGLLSDEGSIENTIEEAKNILHELKDVGFLESISEEGGIERIKVHPLIRDMAIYITKATPKFLIKAGLGFRKPPLDNNNWPKDLQKASLMRNDLEVLSYQPDCPNLSSLLLQYNPLTGEFCDNFFHGMPNLKVLDLSYTGVHILPKSLSSLKNLRALFLRSCWNLKSLPSLSELESLMVFDLSDTHIREIPQGMDKLIRLKRLDLTRTFVEIFPPGLLNKFEHLKELLMDGCGFLWGSESLNSSKRPYIEELPSLENVIILELNFCNSQVFHIFVNSRHLDLLKGFKFSVGGLYKGKLGMNSLAFIGEPLVNGTPILLPIFTSELHFTCCDSITQLTIPTLMTLKIVDVSECKNLKYLFKRGMLHHVPNLEEIAIRNCPNMEEVIEQEQMDNYAAVIITFRKLQKLILFKVPNLKSIYRGIVVCDSLQTIAVWKCNKLKKFPVMAHVDDKQKLVSPSGLKVIMGDGTWLEEFVCDLPDVKTVLQQLFIEVSSPHEIFTSKRTAPSLAPINGSVSISGADQRPILYSGADQPPGHTPVSSQVPVQTNPAPPGHMPVSSQVPVQTNPAPPGPPKDMVKIPNKQREFDSLAKSFVKIVDGATENNKATAIDVVVDRDVFRSKNETFTPISKISVFSDDLMALINFKEIGMTVMNLHMCALYNRARELGVEAQVRFALPAGEQGNGVDTTVNDLYGNIATGLPGNIFLYPYNIGFHWVLVVIDPMARHMWYFDPSDKEMPDNLVVILKSAFLKYSLKFFGSEQMPKLEKAMCPRQHGSVECGYYVMRYMKDVIESHWTHPASLFNNREPYETTKTDAVRLEIMCFIQDNM